MAQVSEPLRGETHPVTRRVATVSCFPMQTVKRVHGPEPLWTTRSISNRPPPRAVQVLGAATERRPVTLFEQALREAIVGLRESMARIEAEVDPLAKHLGFRALNRDAGARGLDEKQLSQPDEQAYARQLLDAARGREAQSFAALDEAARLDLEVLLHLEERLHAREEASSRRAAATRDDAAERARVERLWRDLERKCAVVDRLTSAARPLWLRVMGVVLGLTSLVVFGVVLRIPRLLGEWAQGLPALRWTTVLGTVGFAALGAWLSVDPRQWRAWLLARVQRLAETRRGAAERAARAAEELTRARKLFEQVDDECRREAVAALAVFQRRPGAQRYVNTSGTVVVLKVE